LAVHFSDLRLWSTPKRAFVADIPDGWSHVRIGDMVKQAGERIKVEAKRLYNMTGVKWYGEGVFARETVLGKEMSANYVTPLIPGALIYNRLFAWKGSFAVVPEDFGEQYVSNEFPQFVVDPERVLPEYLYLYCMSSKVMDAVNRASAGSAAVSRNRLKESAFLDIDFLLPPVDVQRDIVQKWRDARAAVEATNNRIQKHERTLLANLLHEAGIEINSTPKRPEVFALDFQSIVRWGVEFNRHRWTPENILQSTRFSTAPLSELAWVNPGCAAKLDDDALVSFVPMEAVSDLSGEIIIPQIRPFAEVRNGYTRFVEGDVIWAKITPCMQNGKSAVARGLQNGNGFGSTEFHVIRVKDTNHLKPEFVWILLRLPALRQAAQRFFIGSAGQQRVPTEFLETLHIPVPPIDIQEAILTKVDIARRAIAVERNAIKELSERTKAEIEAAILGGFSK
jgi:type I restriction enzyme S subunit